MARKISYVHRMAGTVSAHVNIHGFRRKYQEFQSVSLCFRAMMQSPGRTMEVVFRKKVLSFILTGFLYVFVT